MEQKVKDWILIEYKNVSRPINAEDSFMIKYRNIAIENAIHRCYGIIMFAINNCFEDYNDELAKWWDDEMLHKFKALKRRE